MSASSLSRDLALRIGLAARSLPDTDPRRLINVLIACVGMPLTAEKLAQLKVKDLKTAADGEFAQIDAEALKTALHHLKTDSVLEAETLPTIQAFTEGDMPGSIRVACASNHGDDLDGHFGSCARFLIYQVSAAEIRLIDMRSTHPTQERALTDDKNTDRAQLISDCHLLYVVSIGGPPAAKVVKAGVHPVKIPEGGRAPELLRELQTVLAGTPPPWLAKIIGVSGPKAHYTVESDETDG